MKFLVLISIFGLSIFLRTYENAFGLMAQAQLCFYQGQSYPEGSIANINGRTCRCVAGKWVPV